MKSALAIAILGLGCARLAAAQPVPDESHRVSMKYDAAAMETAPAAVRGACPVAIRSLSDRRFNKETVGSDFKPLLSGDPMPWMREALRNLKAYGYTVRDAAGTGSLQFDAALTRAYVWTASMRINAMVAMEVEFERPSGEKATAKYRAFGGKTNVWGATDEFMTTLNYAMNNLLAKLAADLQKYC
jgi:hypothetical protein